MKSVLSRITSSPPALVHLSAVLVGVLFLLFLSVKPAGVFWSLDEGGKFIYLQNVIRTGDPAASIDYPGAWLDRESEFIPLYFYGVRDGAIVSWWPVGFPLVSLPLYLLLGWYGLMVIPLLSGVACCWLSGLLFLEVRPGSRWAPAVVWAVGLATPVFFYSLEFWEHTPAAACVTGMILLLVRLERTHGVWDALGAGVLAGLSVFLRTECAAFAAGAACLLVARNRRSLAPFLGAAGLTSLVWIVFNYRTMGGLFGAQWAPIARIGWFHIFTDGGWRTFAQLLFGSWRYFAVALPDEVLAAGTVLGAGLFFVPWLHRRPRLLAAWFAAVIVLCLAELTVLYGYRSVHGLIQAAPLVCLAGLFFVRREGGTVEWLQALTIAMTGLFAAAYFARGWSAAGGMQWGPRYLLPFYPLFVTLGFVGIAGLQPAWDARLRRVMGVLAAAAALIGFGVEIRGQLSENFTLDSYKRVGATLSSLGGSAVASTCSWATMVAPELYWQGNIFYVTEDADALRLWKAAARDAGAGSAYRAEVIPCRMEMLEEIAAGLAEHPCGVVLEPIDLSP